MAGPITGISPLTLVGSPEVNPIGATAPGAAGLPSGASFGETLTKALSDANAAERTAETMSQRFAAGDPTVGIHEVMIAAEKASIAVRFAVTATTRAVDAYRELMSTPL